MSGFGWKAGIGTASRLLPGPLEGYRLGALVLTNTGRARDLRVDGVPVGRYLRPPKQAPESGGSIIILLATDAPLESRQLHRVAKRATFGLARMGGIADHGSGDFVIAFSTGNRISARGEPSIRGRGLVAETDLTGLFRAAVEATEEAILNSLLRSETLEGREGVRREAIPIEELLQVLERYADRGQSGGIAR